MGVFEWARLCRPMNDTPMNDTEKEMTATLTESGLAPSRGFSPAPHLRRAWDAAESHCNRCGFCLPVCPTYRLTGAESASPRGRLDLMYAAADGKLELSDIAPALGLCLGCLACQSACPSGVPFGELLEAGRIDVAGEKGPAGFTRFLLGTLLDSPAFLKLAARTLYFYQRSGLQKLLRLTQLLRLAPTLARMERGLPPLPRPASWRGQIGPLPAASRSGGAKPALFFSGCVMDAVFGEVHRCTLVAMRHNGYTPVVPNGQGCCGALALHSGAEALAKEKARRNIAAFEAAGDPPVVVNSAGCGAAMKAYGGLLSGDSAWRGRAERFSARVVDVSELLTRETIRPPEHAVPMRVAYDDPCHLAHAQNIRDQPRMLLQAVPQLELVELPEADWCCGSAGSYSLTHPKMAARVLERKMDHIAAAGVQAVATGNPGCLFQLALGAEQRGLAIRIVHPVQLLALAYTGREKA